MVDFLVRETRAVVDGKMVFARFGTCGSPQQHIPIGTVVVTPSAVSVTRNVDAFLDEAKRSAATKKALDFYNVSKPVSSDTTLTKLVSYLYLFIYLFFFLLFILLFLLCLFSLFYFILFYCFAFFFLFFSSICANCSYL